MIRSHLRSFCLLLFLLFAHGIHAQSPAEAMYLNADEKLQSGNIAAAAKILEEITMKFPTFENIWTVHYNLGYAYYILENHDKAIGQFRDLANNKAIDTLLREQSSLMLSGVYRAKASTKTDKAEKSKLLTVCIATYDDFLRTFPETKYRGEALYGKAAAYFQLDKSKEAEQMAGDCLRTNPQHSLLMEARYLLGRIYAKRAVKATDQQKKEEAAQWIEQSQKMFNEVSKNAQDILLANQALYSTGELYVNNKLYRNAIGYLRNVKPRKFLDTFQTQRVESLNVRKTQANNARNKVLTETLQQEYNKALQQLNTIRNETPLYFHAQQLVARCFYELGQYDEVIVLSRHFLSIFDEQQKKIAQYLIVKAFLQKKDTAKAESEYQAFKTLYPTDPIVGETLLTISKYYMDNGKYEDCIKWAEEYKKEFAEGRLEEEAYFLVASAYTAAKDTKKAEEASKLFQRKFPQSLLISSALFNEGFAQYTAKDYPTAIKSFQTFLSKYPDTPNTENAFYIIGVAMLSNNQFDDAVKQFKEFETKFPKSTLMANVLYQMAQAYHGKKALLETNKILARVVTEFPEAEVASFSQYAIGENLLSLGPTQYAAAIAAFEKFVELFPDLPNAPVSLMRKAEILKSLAAGFARSKKTDEYQKKIDEAILTFKEITTRYPDSDMAAEALISTADIDFQKAFAMAIRPEKLQPDRLEEWKKLVQQSQDVYEEVLKKYPEKPATNRALTNLVQIGQTRVQSNFDTRENFINYFNNLSSSAPPALQNKISFAVGGLLTALNDKEAAIKILDEAFANAGSTSLPSAGYQQYRALLIEQKNWEKALLVSKKQLEDKSKTSDETGIAEARLGMGRVYFEMDNLPKAEEQFKEVMTRFGHIDTAAPEAEFFNAQIVEKKKNTAEAIRLYNELLAKFQNPKVRAKNPTLTPAISLRLGYCMEDKAAAASGDKTPDLKEALGYFLRIGTTYEALPAFASEGLYKGSEIYEKLAKASSDPKVQKEFMTNATRFYKQCADKFPDTVWAQKSKARLKSL